MLVYVGQILHQNFNQFPKSFTTKIKYLHIHTLDIHVSIYLQHIIISEYRYNWSFVPQYKEWETKRFCNATEHCLTPWQDKLNLSLYNCPPCLIWIHWISTLSKHQFIFEHYFHRQYRHRVSLGVFQEEYVYR